MAVLTSVTTTGASRAVVTLSNRSLLDQAKGAVALRFHVHPDTALGLLHGWADELEVDTLTVARTLVYAVGARESGSGFDPIIVRYLCDVLGEPAPRLLPRRTAARLRAVGQGGES